MYWLVVSRYVGCLLPILNRLRWTDCTALISNWGFETRRSSADSRTWHSNLGSSCPDTFVIFLSKDKGCPIICHAGTEGGGGRVIGPPIRKLSAKWGWANLLPGKIPSTYCTAVTRSLVKRVIGLWSEWSRNRVLIPRISKGFPFSSIHTGSEIRPASHLMGSFGQFVGPSSWPLTAIFRLVDVECRGRVRAVHWRVVSPQGEQQQMKWWTWSYG